MQNVESSAHLSLPLRLALGVTPSVPDEPVSGRIEIPAGDLQILPLIVPQVQSARGRFDLSAEISGTARSPKLSGKSRIKDGLVRPANRSEVIEGLNAELKFDESRISLDTLTARQGRTGRLRAKGAVLLDGGHLKSYRFDLALRDFAASEEGLYAMLFDGDFVVSDGPRVGGELLPQVTGKARIKKGVIEFDFANQTEVQKRAATTEPLYWTYRIQVEATSNLRWRPQDADIEFNASLDLQQTPDSLLIFGEMHALRGTYWFLSNRFKILNADLTFDNQQGVDPLLDIAAETRVSPPTPSDPMETITAQLTGRSSKPVVSVTSNSGWEQRQILAQLTIGQDSQGKFGPRSAADPLDNYFTRQLNAQLSAGLSEFFRGAITDWELQRDQGGLLSGQGDYVVGVGSQVTDKLALRYRQRIGLFKPTDNTLLNNDTDLFERSVEAEYRLNRFIFVTSDLSKRRSTLGTTTAPNTDYNLNLKARWEY
jgi:autotransporter translocation and assembly factor TamB